MLMLSPVLHGLDERAWSDPLTVDFHRSTADHMAFGKGVHKCPGANLARRELIIVLEEWMKRIPDFRITPGEFAVTVDGQVMGVRRLPLSW
jgi:cytochrome P450